MRLASPLNKAKKLLTIFTSLSCIILASCINEPNEPLRLASSPWPGYEPIYLARDLDYLPESKINIFELPSSDITMEAFRNRSADIATLTLDETLHLIDNGMKVRILLALDISHGGDAVLARPEIQTLSDIRGHNVSIVNIPLGLYMLRRTLDFAGLERKDVNVFPMAESKQEKFYLDRKADVIITFEPVKSQLIEEGAHVIFDSSQIPNEIFDLLVVHEDVYQNRKEDLCALANAWFKSLSYIQQNRRDAAQRITRRLGVDISLFDGMMDGIIQPDAQGNKHILGESPSILVPADKLAALMHKEKMTDSLNNIKSALAPEFSHCY